MALNIMQTIKPVGTFPAVEAADVLMPDGTRLSEKEFSTDAHINALIDAKLGVIENGTY